MSEINNSIVNDAIQINKGTLKPVFIFIREKNGMCIAVLQPENLPDEWKPVGVVFNLCYYQFA